MTAISRGYRALRADDVRLEPWNISVAGGPTLVSPEVLEDWTYYQSIEVHLTLLADLGSALDRLQLSEGATLGAVIVWNSAGTSLRGASQVVAIENNETSVALSLEGSLLRGALSLECQVILLEPGLTRASPIAPAAQGSVLWSARHSVRLEGIGARMPTLAVPFSEYFAGDATKGLWWLQVQSTDFHVSADSTLWVWLNEESPAIRELLEEPMSDGAVRTQQFLKADIYRQLIETGLRDSDFSLDEEYLAGSLGAVISGPMRLLTDDLQSLRQRFQFDSQRLEAEIQIRLGIL